MSTEVIMVLFIKNEKGIAMPVYVRPTDTIDLIWSECCFSSALNGNSLKGKALYYKDILLERKKFLSDYPISRGSIINLKTVET